MATKVLNVLCLIALVSSAFALPVEEVKNEDKQPVQPQVPQQGVVQSQVVGVVPEEEVRDPVPQGVVHNPVPLEVANVPVEQQQVVGGPVPEDLVGSPDANPAQPQDGSDLETDSTFYFGYRPWGGYRRGWGGRGYGGYGGWGGYGGYGGYGGGYGGWGGYGGGWRRGWGHGYWG